MSDPLTHAGVIRAIDGRRMSVAVATQGCASCGQKKSCGVGQLAGTRPSTLIELPASEGLQAGDPVTLSLDAATIHRAALLGYLLPAILLMAGTVAGDVLAEPGLSADLGAALGALAGGGIGLLLARLGARRLGGLSVQRAA